MAALLSPTPHALLIEVEALAFAQHIGCIK
jgi:hypothetical protein